MKRVLGSCSNCGGNVVLPAAWYSVIPPSPTCEKCGAKAKKPIIEMEPAEVLEELSAEAQKLKLGY